MNDKEKITSENDEERRTYENDEEKIEEIYQILLALRWDGMHYTYKPIEFTENYPNPDEQDRDNIDEMINEIKTIVWT